MKLIKTTLTAVCLVGLLISNAPDAHAKKKKRRGRKSVMCLDDITGAITGRRKCKDGETQLDGSSLGTLALGPQGEQGAQGNQGDQGEKGDRGLSGYNKIPALKTVKGVVGGRFMDQGMGIVTRKYMVHETLRGEAPLLFTNENVIVKNTAACGANPACIHVEDSAAVLQDKCTGSFENPTAPIGIVCIYPSAISNAEEIRGYAIPNDAGRQGFALEWEGPLAGQSRVEATYAYKAPFAFIFPGPIVPLPLFP